MKITVIEDFLNHVKGDVIDDVDTIIEYLSSEWQNHFVVTEPAAKTDAPVDPAP